MLLYSDPLFVEHDTGRHPEQPDRIRRVNEHLKTQKLASLCRQMPVAAAEVAAVSYVHDADYIDSVREFAAQHGGYIEADTVVCEASFRVAMNAVGAVTDAVRQVVGGKDKRALCLVRPPGHHALPDSAMGFCLFNNVAVGARTAVRELDLDRVLVVDWDVHHGNGTQDTFWSDEQVAFFSIHRWPFYPGSGRADETGAGKGLGTILNLPVEFGTSRRDYVTMFTDRLTEFANTIKPDLVILSAGFDAHRLDPIGSLGLEVEDFQVLTQAAINIANQHADGRIVSALEGGYNLDILPLCVAAHLKELL